MKTRASVPTHVSKGTLSPFSVCQCVFSRRRLSQCWCSRGALSWCCPVPKQCQAFSCPCHPILDEQDAACLPPAWWGGYPYTVLSPSPCPESCQGQGAAEGRLQPALLNSSAPAADAPSLCTFFPVAISSLFSARAVACTCDTRRTIGCLP